MDNSIDLDLNRSLAIPFVAYNLYCVAEQKSDNRGTRLANEYSISVGGITLRSTFLINLILACINRFFRGKKKKNYPRRKIYFKRNRRIMDILHL